MKAFSGQRHEYGRFADKVDQAAAAGAKKALRAGVVCGLTWFSIFVSYGAALWFGCWLIRTNKTNDFYDTIFICERERHRETQRETQRERETHTHTERDRNRQAEKDRATVWIDRETEKGTKRQIDRQIDSMEV